VLYFDGDILLADYMLDVDINIRKSNAIKPPQVETITQPTATDITAPELHSQDEEPATDETNELPHIGTATQPTATDIPAPELHSHDEAPATDETSELPQVETVTQQTTTNIPTQPATSNHDRRQ